jgi:hypothetical protein
MSELDNLIRALKGQQFNTYRIPIKVVKNNEGVFQAWKQTPPVSSLTALLPEWELISEGTYDDVSEHVRKMMEKSKRFIDGPKYKLEWDIGENK